MDQLARLVAIEEIKQLKARYFRFMDERNWDAMALVFARDARFDCTVGFQYTPLGSDPIGPEGPVTIGREAIITWIKDAFLRQTSVHHGHCHEISIDSATEAHGTIAMEDYIFAADSRTKVLQGAGHYHERYRIEDGAWRISESRLTRLYNNVDESQFYTAGVDEPQN